MARSPSSTETRINGALEAYVKLMRAAESVTNRVHAVLPPDVTITQFAVLEALLHKGPLCQGEIAAKVLRSSGNLTLVLKNLEAAGSIRRERTEEDRRVLRIELTPSGDRLIRSLFPKVAAAITRQFSVLSAGERSTLSGLSKKLGLGSTALPSAK